MKTLLLTVLLMVCAACSTIDYGVSKGREVNDSMIKGARKTICEVASVGAVRREFDTPEEKETWQRLCIVEEGFGL